MKDIKLFLKRLSCCSLILVMFSCGFIPVKYRALEEPVAVTFKNPTILNFNITVNSGAYAIAKIRLTPNETKTIVLEYKFTQIEYKSDVGDFWWEFADSRTEYSTVKPQKEKSSSGGGDPVRLILDILRVL